MTNREQAAGRNNMSKLQELPAGWRYVLVIRTPATQPEQLAALREHVLESLASGVLVLPDEHLYCLDILPPLGDVQTMSPEYYAAVEELFEEPPPGTEPEPRPQEMDVSLHGGRCAEEKRSIQLRLQAYRAAHGLGCWAEVARASALRLTEDDLREMVNGSGVFPVSQWRAAEHALDKLEGPQG